MFFTSVGSNTASTGASSASGAGSNSLTTAQAQQDRFLKLFVAQLNNQDPMNPMDNAQMTTQMAQINTVAGLEKLNDTIKTMSSQFSTVQTLQAANMVGHGVLLASSTLSVDAGVAKGSIDLAGNADKVSVQILDASGSVIDTVELGAKNAGRTDFQWNASAYPNLTNPKFKVTATLAGKAVSTTSLARDTIASVGTDASGALSVQLKGRSAVAYSAIQAFL